MSGTRDGDSSFLRPPISSPPYRPKPSIRPPQKKKPRPGSKPYSPPQYFNPQAAPPHPGFGPDIAQTPGYEGGGLDPGDEFVLWQKPNQYGHLKADLLPPYGSLPDRPDVMPDLPGDFASDDLEGTEDPFGTLEEYDEPGEPGGNYQENPLDYGPVSGVPRPPGSHSLPPSEYPGMWPTEYDPPKTAELGTPGHDYWAVAQQIPAFTGVEPPAPRPGATSLHDSLKAFDLSFRKDLRCPPGDPFCK